MAQASPLSVLIVENGRDMRDLLRTRLSVDGRFNVLDVEAYDGDVAVDLCALYAPDVVVLDVMMPVRDGIDALPAIRGAAPDARVIVYSAGLPTETHDAAIAAGAHAVVSKHESLDELVHAVERLFPDLPPRRAR